MKISTFSTFTETIHKNTLFQPKKKSLFNPERRQLAILRREDGPSTLNSKRDLLSNKILTVLTFNPRCILFGDLTSIYCF